MISRRRARNLTPGPELSPRSKLVQRAGHSTLRTAHIINRLEVALDNLEVAQDKKYVVFWASHKIS